jgi:hypothetical protein
VDALVAYGFDAVKLDACAPAFQNLSRYVHNEEYEPTVYYVYSVPISVAEE